ncbi:hypothetical protein N2152v2_004018 [Parachlorella kessleri]
MSTQLSYLITLAFLVSGALASRELRAVNLSNPVALLSTTPDCAPLDLAGIQAFIATRGTATDAFEELSEKLSCKLTRLTESAIAGNKLAEASLRIVYQLWRLAFKPEQWRKPDFAGSNGATDRFQLWLSNLQTILSINNSTLGYKASLNAFADMSWSEFRASMLMHGLQPTLADFAGFDMRRRSRSLLMAATVYTDESPSPTEDSSSPSPVEESPVASPAPVEDAPADVATIDDAPVEDTPAPAPPVPAYPDAVDWVAAGKVTPVGFQGQCAASWVFASVGALESKLLINTAAATGVNLSEQEMLDCVTPHLGYNLKNANCSGGYMADVFAFTAANSTATESLYPYTGKNVTGCKASMLAGLVKQRPQGVVKTGAAAPGYLRVPQGRTGMLKAIAQQPVAAYMAIDPTFQFYSSGVYVGGALAPVIMLDRKLSYTICSAADMSHAVLLVGYNATAAMPFMTFKNSWGSSWGRAGYGQVFMAPDFMGTCGIYSVSAPAWK